jgi:6-phosphogluconolactonase
MAALRGFEMNVRATPEAASRAAAHAIARWAKTCVHKQGSFSLALSGGSTPRATYRLMASPPLSAQFPWPAMKIFFGDERFLPHNHPDSNYRMASFALLDAAPIPARNIFPMPTRGKNAARCAANYEHLLRKNSAHGVSGFPVFDLILLGFGLDGHVASLFPHTPALREARRWVTWSKSLAAKPPVRRLTITAPVIWNAAAVFLLATGEEKAPLLTKLLTAQKPIAPLPARLLWKCRGRVALFLDRNSAQGLP